MTVMPAGDVGMIAAAAHHYEGGRGPTTLIIYGTGPMTTTFVEPR